MQPKQARQSSGSRAEIETVRRPRPAWEQEWSDAAVVDRREVEGARTARKRLVVALAPVGVAAALLPSILPLTPGFSRGETTAAAVAAVVVAVVALAIVPLADRLARRLPGNGSGDRLVFTAALLSAGAAAIHFSVAKMHFDEYTLFGLFFVGSGIAQLVWPAWVVVRRWPALLVLGAVGNALIVAMWAVDRIWGLPLGPDPWKPDPVGFGDTAASSFEVLLVIACLVALGRGRRRRLDGSYAVALTTAVVAVTALSLLSVLGVGSSFLTPTQ